VEGWICTHFTFPDQREARLPNLAAAPHGQGR
jgi:hypothetical protein